MVYICPICDDTMEDEAVFYGWGVVDKYGEPVTVSTDDPDDARAKRDYHDGIDPEMSPHRVVRLFARVADGWQAPEKTEKSVRD